MKSNKNKITELARDKKRGYFLRFIARSLRT